MALEYKNTIKIEEYMKLREAVGFNKRNIEQSKAGFKNANKVIGCYDGEKAIGCARILWDGGCTAYLCDVLVDPEYQHRGIGSKMINELIDFLKAQLKEGWEIRIVLIAADGKEQFYEKLGFSVHPNKNFGVGMGLWLRNN